MSIETFLLSTHHIFFGSEMIKSIYYYSHFNIWRSEIEAGVQNFFNIYSKNCLKQSLKIDKTKVLMANGSLMKVESIAECSLRAFCNTFDLH